MGREMNEKLELWGVCWINGPNSGWYEHLGEIALGTESDARDKADRLNDKDVEGKFYRAERYRVPTIHA
jgi:hypothetical protein